MIILHTTLETEEWDLEMEHENPPTGIWAHLFFPAEFDKVDKFISHAACSEDIKQIGHIH